MELSQLETAQGMVAVPVVEVARLLLECPAFLSRIKAANAAEAVKRVHLFDLEEEPETLKGMRPFAAIWPKQLSADGNFLRCKGSVALILSDHERYPNDRNRSALDFATFVGEVFDWLRTMSGVSDRLPIRQIVQAEDGPHRNPPQDDASAGSYWWTQFLVHWDQDA
jgi:hypothetical protein